MSTRLELLNGVLVARYDDTARTVTTYDAAGAVLTTRPYTPAENTAADAHASDSATLTDLAQRVARIEAALWPTPTTPTTPTVPTDPAIKTWAQWSGVVPAGSLLKDTDSKVYRNVAGVPLTTPPSGMPGGPGPWTHLWAPITIGTGGTAWATGVAYKVGDVVTYQSKTYKCAQAHSSQAGWDPVSVPALWTLQP